MKSVGESGGMLDRAVYRKGFDCRRDDDALSVQKCKVVIR